jgi:hypothetical protein
MKIALTSQGKELISETDFEIRQANVEGALDLKGKAMTNAYIS